jgi:hypothetical protein
MPGFISNPMTNEAPRNDPWTLWRYAQTLGRVGSADAVKVANEYLDTILANPKTSEGLREMAEERKQQGWEPVRTYKWKPGDCVPF